MYKGKNILTLIPARAGSKRLRQKNIRNFAGRPLIDRTISEALKSRYLDRVIVSTDSKYFAGIAKKAGADVPFIRPKNLARDESMMFDVILHAIKWAERHKNYFEMIMLLQPTSPLRDACDIDRAVESLFLNKAKAVVSVCPCEYHPYWAVRLEKNGRMSSFLKQSLKNRRSLFPAKFYRINGAIYLSQRDYLVQNKGFFGPDTFAYLMPAEKSVDIDTGFDFKIAEHLLKLRHKSGR